MIYLIVNRTDVYKDEGEWIMEKLTRHHLIWVRHIEINTAHIEWLNIAVLEIYSPALQQLVHFL